MNESEWLASDDPWQMVLWLDHEGRRPSGRGVGLFCCACLRHVRPLLNDPRSLEAVAACERWVLGTAGEAELVAARERAWLVVEPRVRERGWTPWHHAASLCWIVPRDLVGRPMDAARTVCNSASAATRPVAEWAAPFARLAREFLTPCGPSDLGAAPQPEALAIALAAEDDFALLPVLADALEEGGTDPQGKVITHLRSPGPHQRGCWALDLVLGRHRWT